MEEDESDLRRGPGAKASPESRMDSTQGRAVTQGGATTP